MILKSTIKLFALFIAITVIYSCSSTNKLSITVPSPAPVYFPMTINNIGILDRTVPNESNQQIDKVDKILSLEGLNLDKDGVKETVQGLYYQLQKNPNINHVKIVDNSAIQSQGLGIFPAALSWEEVESICELNNVKALFVVSFYDTETNVKYSTRTTTIANPFGVKIPMIEHVATINTLINIGFRIYDIEHKNIRDEFVTRKAVVSEGSGINPLKAIEAVLNRKQAVLQLSKEMGTEYATQILPFNKRVSREYYVRGSDNFKVGKRRAQTGNWDGAAELWKAELDNSKAKIAGRANYNMAIISEINGNLDEAIVWASKSYTDYNNKKALNYSNILKNRIVTREQLKLETQK